MPSKGGYTSYSSITLLVIAREIPNQGLISGDYLRYSTNSHLTSKKVRKESTFSSIDSKVGNYLGY